MSTTALAHSCGVDNNACQLQCSNGETEACRQLLDNCDNVCLVSSVIINEAVVKNSMFEDEDGDTPDWFELKALRQVDLTGWTITDDPDSDDRWQIPNVVLQKNDYMHIWASDKEDKQNVYRTLVSETDEFFWTISFQSSTDWKEFVFDENGWSVDTGGFGYGDDDDTTVVSQGTLHLYVRKEFQVDNLDPLKNLYLDIDFDDGFAAYINGDEIARANVGGEPPTTTPTDHEAQIYRDGKPDRFVVDKSVLQQGSNVLAIHLLNHKVTSSDMTLRPFLSAVYDGQSTDGVEPPDILGFTESSQPHANFKLKAGETLALFDSNGVKMHELPLSEKLTSSTSTGMCADATNVCFFDTLTPGEANSKDEFQGIVERTVQFSNDGGQFSGTSVELQQIDGATIRYTLDSKVPTEASTQYTQAIPISGNTVIRARVFQQHYIPSLTFSRTYIKSVQHDLPIATLVTDPDNLFDDESGIYVYGNDYENNLPFFGANFWKDWERDVHFSFYEEDGTLEVKLDAGMKIFGGWSRSNDQRSISIFARSRYGDGELKHSLFPELDYDKFEAIVLRSSGQDWMKTNIKDIVVTELMKGSGVDNQAYRSSAVYINGQYWGFYNIREKVNEHFLESKHGVDASEVNILQNNGDIVQGTNSDYRELIEFVKVNALSTEDNYQYVAERIDIDNFIAYWAGQVYIDNTDWPGNNIKFWNSPGTKWRWIMYDTDFSFFRPWVGSVTSTANTLEFSLADNGPGWPNPPWSTLLMRKLLQNTGFKHKFINRFADDMNTRFKYNAVVSAVDRVSARVDSEIQRHYSHWYSERSDYWKNQNMFQSRDQWLQEVEKIEQFAQQRPVNMKTHIRGYFGIDGMFTLGVSVDNNQAGQVRLNSILLDGDSWSGEYFDGIPVTLEAIPNEGYEFVKWENDDNQKVRIIYSEENANVVAIFQQTSGTGDATPACALGTVYISEAHGKGEPEDYIEIYNSGDADCSMFGFQLDDEQPFADFTFGDVVIEAGGYWLGYEDADNSFTFGISGGGDTLYLGDGSDNVYKYETLAGDLSTNFDGDQAVLNVLGFKTGCPADPTPRQANSVCL